MEESILEWVLLYIILEQCWKDGLIKYEEYLDLLWGKVGIKSVKKEWISHIIWLVSDCQPLISVPKANDEVYKLNERKITALLDLDEYSAIDEFIKLMNDEDFLIILPQYQEDTIQLMMSLLRDGEGQPKLSRFETGMVQYIEQMIKEIDKPRSAAQFYENVHNMYEQTFPDDIDFEEPEIDKFVEGISNRLKGTYIWESSKIKKLWRDGLINQEECEKRIGDLGFPDNKSIWVMRWIKRRYKLLKDPEAEKEKTILKIRPSNKINKIR